MLALASVWLSLASVVLSAAMLLYRPFFTDWGVTLVLYFGSPGALCFSGLVMWSLRKEPADTPGVSGQRAQAGVGAALAIVAAAIVYALVIRAQPVQRVEAAADHGYDARLALVEPCK